MKLKKLKTGYTLAEIVVVIAILALISGALAAFQVSIFQQNSFLTQNLQAEQDARMALKRLTAELRQAAPSDTGAFQIALADKDKLTFYSDLDGDSLHERVRYYLATTTLIGTLMRAVLKPTGSPLVYVDANEKVGTAVANIINSNNLIFSYFDKNYAGTSSPLTLPITLPSVRLVKISLTIEADPNRAPAPITYESQVSIRSLKDNL